MSSSPDADVAYIDIHVPNAKTEQEFLRLAVQVAAKKYRNLHDRMSLPPSSCEEVLSV